jgi:hypothetical protein
MIFGVLAEAQKVNVLRFQPKSNVPTTAAAAMLLGSADTSNDGTFEKWQSESSSAANSAQVLSPVELLSAARIPTPRGSEESTSTSSLDEIATKRHLSKVLFGWKGSGCAREQSHFTSLDVIYAASFLVMDTLDHRRIVRDLSRTFADVPWKGMNSFVDAVAETIPGSCIFAWCMRTGIACGFLRKLFTQRYYILLTYKNMTSSEKHPEDERHVNDWSPEDRLDFRSIEFLSHFGKFECSPAFRYLNVDISKDSNVHSTLRDDLFFDCKSLLALQTTESSKRHRGVGGGGGTSCFESPILGTPQCVVPSGESRTRDGMEEAFDVFRHVIAKST